MHNEYSPDIAPAGFDAQVSAVADSVREAGGGSSFVVAIRNEAGQIYRHLRPTDSAAFVQLCDALEELGLVDELEGDDDPDKANGAVFHLPERRSPRRTRLGDRVRRGLKGVPERRGKRR